MLSLSSLFHGQGNRLFPSVPIFNPPFLGRTHFGYNLPKMSTTQSKLSTSSTLIRNSLSNLVPLEAIIFDIDGTLCDSDPLHYYAFREMLQELGYNDGVPITEEFFIQKIAGKHNEELSRLLFPDWDLERALVFMDDKEAMFRRLAAENLEPMKGLNKLCKWIEDRGLKRGAVTNAPRSNADLLVSKLGLSDFFQAVVVANDCKRAKPFPDPYLKGLNAIGAAPKHTLVFEDSVSGIKAAVAAGIAVVLGITIRNPEHLLMEAGATFLIKDFDDPKLWKELEALEKDLAQTTAGS